MAADEAALRDDEAAVQRADDGVRGVRQNFQGDDPRLHTLEPAVSDDHPSLAAAAPLITETVPRFAQPFRRVSVPASDSFEHVKRGTDTAAYWISLIVHPADQT